MQFHLVHDPFDSTYSVLLSLNDNFYYPKLNHWVNSVEQALTEFVPFFNTNNQTTATSLLAHMQTLAIFTSDSHPEYFL